MPIRVFVFLSLINFFLVVSSYLLLGRTGIMAGIAVASVINFVFLWIREDVLKNQLGGRQIVGHDSWGLNSQLAEYCAKLRIKPPLIYSFANPCPSVYVSVSNWETPELLVSDSLLKKINPEETPAFCALVASFIKETHGYRRCLLVKTALVVATVSRNLDRMFFGATHPFQMFTAPFIKFLNRQILYPKKIIKIDRVAVELCGDKESLAKLIVNIDSLANTHYAPIPYELGATSLVSPLTKSKIYRYFKLHPPIQKRVTELIGHYPI